MYIKWESVEKYEVYGPPTPTYLTACECITVSVQYVCDAHWNMRIDQLIRQIQMLHGGC